MNIVLHQFAFSHFNEKARWALAMKGVAHERRTYLPGPHMPLIKKLSGQPQTPVLQIDELIVPGSAQIIDELERRFPTSTLYPEDENVRQAALDMQTRFDQELGPAVRTVLFEKLINHGAYITAMFAGEKSWPKRLAYQATFPLARGMIAKGNGVSDPANVVYCRKMVENLLEELATATAATGYLAGDEFSVADLTAAALLAPIASVAHVDMARPKPVPADVAELIASYADHPTIEWAKSIYARHRP